MTPARLPVACAALLLATGCSSSAPPEEGEEPTVTQGYAGDLCSVLSQEERDTLVGASLPVLDRSDSDDPQHCTWTDELTDRFLMVTIRSTEALARDLVIIITATLTQDTALTADQKDELEGALARIDVDEPDPSETCEVLELLAEVDGVVERDGGVLASIEHQDSRTIVAAQMCADGRASRVVYTTDLDDETSLTGASAVARAVHERTG